METIWHYWSESKTFLQLSLKIFYPIQIATFYVIRLCNIKNCYKHFQYMHIATVTETAICLPDILVLSDAKREAFKTFLFMWNDVCKIVCKWKFKSHFSILTTFLLVLFWQGDNVLIYCTSWECKEMSSYTVVIAQNHMHRLWHNGVKWMNSFSRTACQHLFFAGILN